MTVGFFGIRSHVKYKYILKNVDLFILQKIFQEESIILAHFEIQLSVLL